MSLLAYEPFNLHSFGMDQSPDGSTPPPASSLSYPNLTFISISDPKETKSRAKKRAVRSHVAYYQHHKDDDKSSEIPGGAGPSVPRRRRTKRNSLTHLTMNETAGRSTTSLDSGLEGAASGSEASLTPMSSRKNSLSPYVDMVPQGTRIDSINTYPGMHMLASVLKSKICDFVCGQFAAFQGTSLLTCLLQYPGKTNINQS